MEAFLKLESSGKEITLNNWLDIKQDMLELMFQLNVGKTCNGKSMNNKNDLFGCEDEMFQVMGDTSFSQMRKRIERMVC